MNKTSDKPLHGIKVVELATFVAAPVCGRMLADMGAEVVKVESPSGDQWRDVAKSCTYTDEQENPLYDVYNAGKKSICLDIKNPLGMQVLMDLLKDADVFITNTRARSLKKLGLDYDTLHERFPQLILATITGYGNKGPDADLPGFDNIAYWTRTGFLLDMAIETEKSYPTYPGTSGGDTVTGTMLFGGVMTALYQRKCTGNGDHVTVALYNAGIWATSGSILQAQERYKAAGIYPKKRGVIPPFSAPYQCGDGGWVNISVLDYRRHRDVFFRVLGVEQEMAAFHIPTMTELKLQSEQIIPIIESAFLKRPAADWAKLLEAEGIVCSIMNHLRDVSTDEQAIVNQFVQEYHCRNGATCMIPCPPIRLQSQKAPLAERASLRGEDTNTVLQQLGYPKQQIEEILRTGAAV